MGNALEMIEAIEYLKGNYLPDTYELTTALTAEMLISAGLAIDFKTAKVMIDSAVSSGKALDKFREIIIAQEGNPEVIDNYGIFAQAPVVQPIIADQEGFVHSIDSRAIGYALVRIKAGRMVVSDTIDYGAGALLYPKIGDKVARGEKLGEVHAASFEAANEVAELIKQAYHISPLPKAKEALIFEIARSDE